MQGMMLKFATSTAGQESACIPMRGGLISRLSEELDAYAVVAGDKVVTVGLRYKHIHHP